MYRDLLVERNEIEASLLKYSKEEEDPTKKPDDGGISAGLTVGKVMA